RRPCAFFPYTTLFRSLWTFALGGDGRLYSGTYPGGKLGALDLKTLALEDLGAPSRPNLYLRYTFALPDGRIFCQFGFERPETMRSEEHTSELQSRENL